VVLDEVGLVVVEVVVPDEVALVADVVGVPAVVRVGLECDLVFLAELVVEEGFVRLHQAEAGEALTSATLTRVHSTRTAVRVTPERGRFER
jgi:hypothetical protein